jgi:hypothetical protein
MITVKELDREIGHLREIINEREKQRIQHDQLTELAIDKAVIGIDERLKSMNEFRGQQKDMINTLVTRMEFDMIVRRIGDLEKFQAKIMTIVGLGLFLMPIIFWLLNKFVT